MSFTWVWLIGFTSVHIKCRLVENDFMSLTKEKGKKHKWGDSTNLFLFQRIKTDANGRKRDRQGSHSETINKCALYIYKIDKYTHTLIQRWLLTWFSFFVLLFASIR